MSEGRDVLISTLQLLRTPGLGARSIKLLCDHFGNATRVQEADAVALEGVEGMGKTRIDALLATREDDDVLSWIEQTCERADAQRVRMLASGHEDYPTCLQQIFDPPPLLYVRGSLPETVQGGPRAQPGVSHCRHARRQRLRARYQPSHSSVAHRSRRQCHVGVGARL